MIVPLRPFRTAVKRNVARRRLREFFRLNRDLFPDNCDILVRLFRAPEHWDEFIQQLEKLLKEARTLAAQDNGRTPDRQ